MPHFSTQPHCHMVPELACPSLLRALVCAMLLLHLGAFVKQSNIAQHSTVSLITDTATKPEGSPHTQPGTLAREPHVLAKTDSGLSLEQHTI